MPLAPFFAVCALAVAAAATLAILTAIRRAAEQLEREVIRLGAVSEHVGVLHDAIDQSQRRRIRLEAELSRTTLPPKPDR